MCSLSSLPTEAESVRKQIRTRSVLFIFKTFIPACLHQTVTEIMLLSTQMRANFFAMISTNDPSDPMETSIMHVCSPVSKHAFHIIYLFFCTTVYTNRDTTTGKTISRLLLLTKV